MGHAGLVRGSSSYSRLKIIPNLAMHTGCLTKCHVHLGNSWGGPNLQIIVSLDEKEGGEVSLSKAKTC